MQHKRSDRAARFPWRHRLASWLIRKECERVYHRTGGACIIVKHSIERTSERNTP